MFNLNYYKMKNFLRYANANAMATISICNMDHTVQDLNLWKVDLVQTEIELISLNPAIDGQHKLILEWVITPPDYDETIDNRLTISPKGALRYRSAKIIKETIIEPSDDKPIILDDLDMVKDENGTFVAVIPEKPDYVWYQLVEKKAVKNGENVIIYDKELNLVKK